MKIRFSHKFTKEFRKLKFSDREKTNYAIRLFKKNPFDPSLYNHKLKGDKKGVRSFSAGFDLRILYIEEDGHTIVIMLHVGKHSKVY
ncbi:type II toxin-antitoxin system RelE/ParE family toxin [Candidatus Peribacteria bacterium]|jgi:mRNA-degrading endonuclease YafQ of YafQ-DinJ toxin-antitoxin module|nr:type II toxin-antitoxin system RelE/ParE family toxin [Candidatus Peribacteria bacterium]MBT4021462.1 type II toxin-antitoxin system RelE/ParE family toxin [Candidatus Peribacteria bacterium]MBT4240372.1 type II toxin-antitoxin system RelE/ParE family toxin [Candidatus Peribacteria bacterium]MBT4473795.1 type II toxin-antitoxin system RelE/ParE family toxin [Candidatus Peribacteria bacterium]